MSDRQKLVEMQYTIYDDGNINIEGNWKDESEEIAEIFASLLHGINSGILTEKTVQVLNYSCEQNAGNPKHLQFVQNVINKWNIKAKETLYTLFEQPVVEPKEVFHRHPT